MIWGIVAGFLSGIIGAMGLGGGGVLLIYLAAFMGVEQLKAQGINLLFFIPCALVSVIYNLRKHLVRYKNALCLLAGAIPGLVAGSFLLNGMDTDLLRKLFGGFLIVSGIISVMRSLKSDEQAQ